MKSKPAAFFLLALNLMPGCARAPGPDEATTMNGAFPETDAGGAVVIGAEEAGAASSDAARGGTADTGTVPGSGRSDASTGPDAGGSPFIGAPEAGVAADASPGPADGASPAGSDGGTAPESDAGAPTPDAGSVEPIADAGNPDPADSGAPPAQPRCPPGTYVGVFDGRVEALFGFLTADITGSITITLALSGNGDLLEIQNGMLSGADQRGSPIAANVVGTLNCATSTFEEIRLTNGTYTGSDPVLGGPPQVIEFTGSATGMYFDNPPSAQGRWQVQQDAFGAPSGSGTWTARIMN